MPQQFKPQKGSKALSPFSSRTKEEDLLVPALDGREASRRRGDRGGGSSAVREATMTSSIPSLRIGKEGRCISTAAVEDQVRHSSSPLSFSPSDSSSLSSCALAISLCVFFFFFLDQEVFG